MSPESETQMEYLYWSAEGKFIMDKAREFMWFENRPEVAWELCGSGGLDAIRTIKLLTGEAQLTGWARHDPPSQIMYEEKPDPKFKDKLRERIDWLVKNGVELYYRWVSYQDLQMFSDAMCDVEKLENDPAVPERVVQYAIKGAKLALAEQREALEKTLAFKDTKIQKMFFDEVESAIRDGFRGNTRMPIQFMRRAVFSEVRDHFTNVQKKRKTLYNIPYTPSMVDDKGELAPVTPPPKPEVKKGKLEVMMPKEPQEQFDCPLITLGGFDVPEELIYKYYGSRGVGDQIYAHERIFIWMTHQYEVFRRFFGKWFYPDNETGKLYGYFVEPVDVHTGMAQKHVEDIDKEIASGKIKPTDFYYNWYVEDNLVTAEEARKCNQFQLEIEEWFKQRADDKSIANRRKMERYGLYAPS